MLNNDIPMKERIDNHIEFLNELCNGKLEFEQNYEYPKLL